MIFTLYHQNPKKTKTAISALAVALALGITVFAEQKLQLFFTGVLIGLVFIHFNFGFAGYWGSFWKRQETVGVRSHLWLIAIGTLIFFPALNLLPENGIDAAGAVRPFGVNVLVGAAIFGVGMAISSACSSGTIRLMGEFKLRYYWVFFWMIIGGTFAASQSEIWMEWETWGLFSLATDLPWAAGLLINLAIIGALYAFFIWIEKRKHNQVASIICFNENGKKLQISPLLWATIVLVILNFTILVLSAYPWAISWVFPKLGILGIQYFELPFEWDFWEYTASYESALEKPWTQDNIMLTTLGMFAGVAAYHLISKTLPIEKAEQVEKNKGVKSIQFTHLFTPIIAGSLMGYGAVISFGCNIGGFFSAIISGSLHGWLWLVSAFFALGLTTLIISKCGFTR